MEGLGGQLWAMVVVVAVVGVLALLHYAAAGMANAHEMRELRDEMLRLRKLHEERRKMGINPTIPEVREAPSRKKAA